MNLYNEIDPFAASWLTNLSTSGHIAAGRVLTTSITDLTPDDVRHATQAHFFAGIGAWSYALRLAGWPDDVPVWTGSCPCQPFSVAGKRAGTADARHLWPDWFRLIRECRPVVVFGEQVAGPAGLAWLDAVHADLEGCGYTVGAAVLPAAGVGAPHGRHRLFFVAHAPGARLEGLGLGRGSRPGREGRTAERDGADGAGAVADNRRQGWGQVAADAGGCGSRGQAEGLDERSVYGGAGDDAASVVADPDAGRRGQGRLFADGRGVGVGRKDPVLPSAASDAGTPRSVVHAERDGRDRTGRKTGRRPEPANPSGRHPVSGYWANAAWLPCRDGKARPVEPGTFPLAHGAPARVGRLRGYGNAIVAEVAAEFVGAFLDTMTAQHSR